MSEFIRSKRQNFVVLSLLGLAFTSFLIGISVVMADWHTWMLLEDYELFIEDYNKNTLNGELMTDYANSISSAKENLKSFNQNSYDAFIMAGIALGGSIFFYLITRHEFDFKQIKEKSSTDILYPLLIAMFFSVGIAFYFSLQFIEHSLFSSSAAILALIEPFTKTRFPMDDNTAEIILRETFVTKLGLIIQVLFISLKDYSLAAYNLTYFFGIFLCLLFGIFFKSILLRNVFFISGMIAGGIWILDTWIKFLPSLEF